MNKCTKCGTEFEGNFCPSCGTPFQVRMFCPRCGTEVKPNQRFCSGCGAQFAPPPQQQQTAPQNVPAAPAPAPAPAPVEDSTTFPSKYTGGAIMTFLVNLVVGFVSIISIGLLFPFMFCWKKKWEAEHTFINGRRLVFDGKGTQLFGRFIIWALLAIVTLGIYFIVKGNISFVAWETKHTHFEGVQVTYEEEKKEKKKKKGAKADVTAAPEEEAQPAEAQTAEVAAEAQAAVQPAQATEAQPEEEEKEVVRSKFDGRWYQLLGVNVLTFFVTLITLTFGAYWAHCYRERWYCKHKTYDNHSLYFDGTGMQYFGKRFVWTLLTIITFGIYSFWLHVRSVQWTVSHTHVTDPTGLPAPRG